MSLPIAKDYSTLAPPPQPSQDTAAISDGNLTLSGLAIKDENKGAVVHSFDANATPQQKAASAGAARAEIGGPHMHDKTSDAAREVAFDTATGPPVQPTITIEDVDATTKEEVAAHKGIPEPMPGTLPEGVVSAIPDWYKVGWRSVSGIDAPPSQLSATGSDARVLSQFLSDAWYGRWYFDAAVVILAVVFTHLFTILHLGWGWLFILLATCATYYSTSSERTRERARDDIQRELLKNKLATEHESAEWINSFLDRFWLIYEPVLSATVVQSVDSILAVSTPPFLDSIRLSTFTLGTKAPRIDRVRTYPRTDDDVVLMEWALSFTPNDITHLTLAQQESKVNPKIVLAIKVGAMMAKATLPILLEDLSFKASVRIKLTLMTTFPHVKTLEISFLEKPLFDYVLKPIGGETFGFDIANIPGLSPFIRDTVHGILGPMMYDPNVFVLNLAQLLSGKPLDAAIGVLQVHVYSARSLKGVKVTGGAPDPYVSLSLNGKAELARTKWQPATYNPYWGEVKFLLVTSLTDVLTLTVMDYNEVRKDMELGTVSWDLSGLKEDAVQEGLVGKVLRDGSERGEVQFDVSFFPVLTPKKLPNGETEPLPDTKAGILRLTIHQAKELDHTKSSSNELNPFAKLYLGQTEIYKTVMAKHTNNPVWEQAKEVLVPDRHAKAAVISVQVIDDREFVRDPLIGRVSVRLDDALKANASGQDWFPLTGGKSGRVRLTAEWKPLNMAGSMESAGAYVPPIGVVRLWVQKAVDVKNVEATLGGKSDPYVRVMLNGTIKARTEVVNNNLNPEWDQIIYVPVHQLRESLLLEIMDYQNLTKDRSLGMVELKVSDLAAGGGDSRLPYKSKGKLERAAPIKLDKGSDAFKGQLLYVADFVPALHLKKAGFDDAPNELEDTIRDATTAQNTEGGIVTTPMKMGNGAAKEGTQAKSPDVPLQTTPTVGADVELRKGHARGMSTASIASVETNATAETAAEEPESMGEGIDMPKEELLQKQSGIIAFNVMSGQLAKRARLEILMDEGYWPVFGTLRARSMHARWEQVGEGFVKELDFGRVWLRLNEKDEGDKEEIVAEVKIRAKEFLEKTLDGPASFTLVNAEGGNKSTIEITSRYIPVDVVLEARESINNMGFLHVDLVDGKNIRGVDRSGKSDPFVVFTLNGARVFKSETQKKTLAPVWNEKFDVMVPSRVAASFTLEVFDWNQIEQARTLGAAVIDLSTLEPFTASEHSIAISHDKHGTSGEIRIRMLFRPEIIPRTRQPTSLVGSTTRAMTRVGTMPIAGARGVVHGVGGVVSGVGHGVGKATHLFHRDRKGSVDGYEVGDTTTSASVLPSLPAPDLPAGQVSAPVGTADVTSSTLPSNTTNTAPGAGKAPQEQGVLKVTVLGAKDLSSSENVRPHVHLRLGDKEQKTKVGKGPAPEWNETLSFTVTPHTPTLYANVTDHKTIGKDKELGDADIDIWRHVQPGVPAADVWIELRSGQGQLRLRMEYMATNEPARGSASSWSPSKSAVSPSKAASITSKAAGSPSRFSLKP